MTNVSPWIYAHSSLHFASLSYYRATLAGIEPIIYLPQNSHHTYLYGISIAIPRYIAMQLSTVPFIMTRSITVILLSMIM